eukprot:g15316.t1
MTDFGNIDIKKMGRALLPMKKTTDFADAIDAKGHRTRKWKADVNKSRQQKEMESRLGQLFSLQADAGNPSHGGSSSSTAMKRAARPFDADEGTGSGSWKYETLQRDSDDDELAGGKPKRRKKPLSELEAAAAAAGLVVDVTAGRAGASSTAKISIDIGESRAQREARTQAEQIFKQYFFGRSREMNNKHLIIADDIACRVIHQLYRELDEDVLFRVEFDGTQGTVLTPALKEEAGGVSNPARGNSGLNKIETRRVVDHSAKWLCIFAELHLLDSQAILPIPTRIHSFTHSLRNEDPEEEERTESFLYARAVALLLEQLLPRDDLCGHFTFLSLASDFGGSSNAAQHYVQTFLLDYILGASMREQQKFAAQRMGGVVSGVVFCEEHPNSTGCCNSLDTVFSHIGLDQKKFLARQWLEATALRHSRLYFAADARQSPKLWDPRPQDGATEEFEESWLIAAYSLLDLYRDDDRRRQHFRTLLYAEGDSFDTEEIATTLLSLLIMLVSPSTMRWGTIGSCARHLSLLNMCHFQDAVTRISPLHCGKAYWLYRGRNDTAMLNFYMGAATLGSDRVTFSYQQKLDAGAREDRLVKIRESHQTTTVLVQRTAPGSFAIFGFPTNDTLALRVLTSTYLGSVTYLVEMEFRYSWPLEEEDWLTQILGPGGAESPTLGWNRRTWDFLEKPEPELQRARASGLRSWCRWMKSKAFPPKANTLLWHCLSSLHMMIYRVVSRTTRRVEGLHATAQRLAVHAGATVSLEHVYGYAHIFSNPRAGNRDNDEDQQKREHAVEITGQVLVDHTMGRVEKAERKYFDARQRLAALHMDDYDREERSEELQSKIIERCVEQYVERTAPRLTGGMLQGKASSEGNGYEDALRPAGPGLGRNSEKQRSKPRKKKKPRLPPHLQRQQEQMRRRHGQTTLTR